MTRRLVVLVVDDDASLRAAHCMLVDFCGHTAIGARGGREALDVLENREVDMIISDLSMPIMGGLEFVGRVRGLSLPRQPYVVIVTSTPEGVSGADIKSLSIRAVLEKPAERDELVTQIDAALREIEVM